MTAVNEPRKIFVVFFALISFLIFASQFILYLTHDYKTFITSYAFEHGWSDAAWSYYFPSAIRFVCRISYLTAFIGLIFFRRWGIYLCLIAWLTQLVPGLIYDLANGAGFYRSAGSLGFLALYLIFFIVCWPVLKKGDAALYCLGGLTAALIIHSILFLGLFYRSACVGGHVASYVPDKIKEDALWTAVQKGNAKTVAMLFSEKDAHLTLRGNNCDHNTICNLISYAAMNGSNGVIDMIKSHGSPIDLWDGGGGDAPLTRALFFNQPDAAKHLVEIGADPNMPNRFGDAPIMVAASLGTPDLVKLMIKSGVNVNSRHRTSDVISSSHAMMEGVTPLMIAAFSGRIDLLQVLLNGGADPSLQDENGRDIFDYIKAGKSPEIASQVKLLISKLPKAKT